MLHLWFSSGEDSLSVRRFSVEEAISSLFEVTVVAVSRLDDIDLESLLGRPASLHLARTEALAAPARTFLGVCSSAALARVEPGGLSTYELRIVPSLWLLTQRKNHRVFQHQSIPEIAAALLREWEIEAVFHLDRTAYPRLEYRVQHGESDFAFLSRLLEEAGIAYTLGEDRGREVVALFDAIESSEPRAGGPVAFEDSPGAVSLREHVTAVRIAHEVRPGRLTLRDFDFLRKPDVPLFAMAAAESPHEARLEQHVYSPGAFFAEGAKNKDVPGDSKAGSFAQEKVGKEQAERSLAAIRGSKRLVTFRSNLLDLRPGTVFSIKDHGHPDLAPANKLLVTSCKIAGASEGEWSVDASAVLASVPYRPARTTAKPVVQGVESAIVVGPEGEEIHTDELGRVRVQFPWDRQGDFDEGSSCWIRVSQGWAGAGYGMFALPRVGQEVIVGFFGGDPDQPIVVGRVHNNASPVPNKLPESRTMTTWRSSTSPGSEGHNEISFEDAKGQEKLFVQAERAMETRVKGSALATIGRDRSEEIGGSSALAVAANQAIAVGGARTTTVGGVDELRVGSGYAVTVLPSSERREGVGPTGIEVGDRRITLTTGEAKITLEGPNITLDAAASLLLNAAASITINGRADIHLSGGASVFLRAEEGDLVLRGGPDVHVNPSDDVPGDEPYGELPIAAPLDIDMDDEVDDAESGAQFSAEDPEWLKGQLAPGGGWDPARFGPAHEDFGYFRLGVVAAAAGIPEGVLLRQVGAQNTAPKGSIEDRGEPGNGLFGGKAPYGNEPRRFAMMKKGTAYFRRNYTLPESPHGP